jgi:catechol 2,3-dioxygenase-like lactoylglutathione lyase family enzyme
MKLTEIAFFTDQVSQMSDFYRRLLDTEPVASSDQMSIFFMNDTRIFIHYRYLAQEGEIPPDNHHAFTVEDVDAVCARLAAQGLRIEIPPQDYYWGRSAYLRDPDGHQIEITQKEMYRPSQR